MDMAVLASWDEGAIFNDSKKGVAIFTFFSIAPESFELFRRSGFLVVI